jgi:hypothetical protein
MIPLKEKSLISSGLSLALSMQGSFLRKLIKAGNISFALWILKKLTRLVLLRIPCKGISFIIRTFQGLGFPLLLLLMLLRGIMASMVRVVA